MDGEPPELIKLGSVINNRLEVDETAVARTRDEKYAETIFAVLGNYLALHMQGMLRRIPRQGSGK